MKLLDRQDHISDKAWQLVRMLSTNQAIYQKVLNINVSSADLNKDEFWEQFFEQGSVYKHVYANEIIEALMEDHDNSIQNVEFIEFLEMGKLVPPKQKHRSGNHQISEDDLLKETWK